ncbi:MAG: hypothetical protein M3O35_13885 [Acidobacteriota bacterium]|nr:hypothetical protein [Acidobacteriota bacterium]
MTRLLRFVPILAALALLTACEDFVGGDWGNSERFKDDFHYSYPLKSGGSLSVENFNGSIEILGWDQDKVEINGTKFASSRSLLDSLKVETSAGPDSVRIHSSRPDWTRGSLGVRYTIRVPRKVRLDTIESTNGAIRIEDVDGVARLRSTNGHIRSLHQRGELDARTTNGGIEIEGLEGNASVHTSNGTIRAEVRHGNFEATTSNGGIHARLIDPPGDRPVKAGTSNGHVELELQGSRLPDVRASSSNSGIVIRLPESASARVQATTTHGSVSSDFDSLRSRGDGRHREHELDGTIGGGGPLIDISTTNGSVKILKM